MKIKAKKNILRKSSFAIFESLKGKQITTFIFFYKDSYQFPRGNNSTVWYLRFFQGRTNRWGKNNQCFLSRVVGRLAADVKKEKGWQF